MKNGKIHPGKLKPAQKKVSRVRFYTMSIFGVWKKGKNDLFLELWRSVGLKLKPNHILFTISQHPDCINERFGHFGCEKKWFPPKLQFFLSGRVGVGSLFRDPNRDPSETQNLTPVFTSQNIQKCIIRVCMHAKHQNNSYRVEKRAKKWAYHWN